MMANRSKLWHSLRVLLPQRLLRIMVVETHVRDLKLVHLYVYILGIPPLLNRKITTTMNNTTITCFNRDVGFVPFHSEFQRS
ncbi:hypothetical protein I7I53_07767 [Histoplasma capsulatum var. duboisii H88]|uniref:Uncharacterized protein n=1 Tax=Ajellomyces capsulatus (strain H88) TaxID=544711 RepID=A0A8A1LHT1_AJEC8|nr:hypothetical protein I7I53_07767 [Histoplasma capsulatum var. duboisii H88]